MECEQFPLKRTAEREAEYYIRVNEWRHMHSIPHEVYVRVFVLPRRPHPEVGEAAPDLAPDAGSEHEEDARDGTPDPEERVQPEKPSNGERKERYSRDWQKPQYIDFRSPMLVNLFGRMTRSLKSVRTLSACATPSISSGRRTRGITSNRVWILRLTAVALCAPKCGNAAMPSPMRGPSR